MKIIVYCQHVLGIGHFFRTLEICRALYRHEIILVTGGPEVPAAVPDHVRVVRMPGLQMNREFKELRPTAPGKRLDEVKSDRKKTLLALFEAESPDIFFLEFYPFGRKAFRFEIDPILAGIANGTLPPARVACSLRDILVEREDVVKYEARIIATLNRYFDLLLVHGDPGLVTLDETFSRTGEISVPVEYTGYVTPAPPKGARDRTRRRLGIGEKEHLVVASAGGGKVGERLFEAVLDAVALMDKHIPLHCHLFTGPYLDQREFERLEALAGPNVRVMRFSENFLSYLAAADLSVSMAGYNTSMNVLAANVPALVWPFPQNREQRLRARRLEKMAALTMLGDHDLQPERLATLMDRKLSAGPHPKTSVNLGGAARTAEVLESSLELKGSRESRGQG